jgi:hypothetical protein
MHVGGASQELAVTRIEDTWAYEFDWSENMVGVGIMEIFVDEQQIPESPIRVQVVQRNCELDYRSHSKTPDSKGTCICDSSTIDLFGKCISSVIFSVVVSLVIVLFVMELGYLYLSYRKKQSDQLWHVAVDELHFDEPVEIIGQGSFGVVLLAEYRGTKVAIKRVLPTNEKRRVESSRGSKDGPVYGSSSHDVESQSVDRAGTHSIESKESLKVAGSNDSMPRVETNSFADGASKGSSFGASSSDDGNLDFLGRLSFGTKQNKWAKLFPWLQPKDNSFRMKNNILGSASASADGTVASSTTTLGRWCPWFDKHTQQKQAFIVEMRLLSRLRHPCITTGKCLKRKRKGRRLLSCFLIQLFFWNLVYRSDGGSDLARSRTDAW